LKLIGFAIWERPAAAVERDVPGGRPSTASDAARAAAPDRCDHAQDAIRQAILDAYAEAECTADAH
jgi:hypothetical protein